MVENGAALNDQRKGKVTGPRDGPEWRLKTSNSAFLAQFAVQRGGDIVSHWYY